MFIIIKNKKSILLAFSYIFRIIILFFYFKDSFKIKILLKRDVKDCN